MKLSIIDDYNKYLLKLFSGHQIDYNIILNKMSYVENCGRFDNEDFIYSNLINKSL